MTESLPSWVVPAVLVIAMVYSMVGHGGASAYLAVLALSPLFPSEIAVIALLINVVVAGTSFVIYRLARHFSWRLFWPFLLGSAPLAFAAATVNQSGTVYFWLIGMALVASSLRLLLPLGPHEPADVQSPSVAVRVGVGAGIGLVSGIIGVGGGIFLSPVLLLARWATAKRTAATSAIFIVVNSVAGLVGRFQTGASIHPETWVLVTVGVLGAVGGSFVGAFVMANRSLQRALAGVLVFSAVRLIFR